MNGRKATDWILLILFVLTAFSGFKLHVAGEQWPPADHSRYIWGCIHAAIALAFATCAFIHLHQHSPWYKALSRKAPNRRLRVRRLAVLTLDSILALLLVSGTCLLLLPESTFHELGMTHYIIGILSILFVIGHLTKRFRLMK